MKKGETIDSEVILTQVRQEYSRGLAFVSPKREKFRARNRMYNLAEIPEDKIAINTLYTTIQTLLASYTQDRASVCFVAREVGDEPKVGALNMLAKYDYEAINGEEMDYRVQWDRLFYGVGIRALVGWDSQRLLPKFEVKDPLSWIPDPDGNAQDGFAFAGFEAHACKNELTRELGYAHIDKIVDETSEEVAKNSDGRKRSRLLGDDTQRAQRSDGRVAVYHHYTTIQGQKYLVTTANKNTLLIRCVPLSAWTEEEAQDSTKIPFPLVFNNYSPLRGDPFGVSVPDLLEDKQKAHSVLANLELLREKFATLGGNFLYDVNMIPNKHDLVATGFGPKFIGVDGARGSLLSAVAEVPRASNSSTTTHIISSLNREVQLATGVDPMQSGVVSDTQITATESQQIQANANLRVLLGLRINAWGEKAFWRLWYRAYEGCFDAVSQKVIRLSGKSDVRLQNIVRNDFILSAHPDICMEITSEKIAKQKENLRSFLGVYPLLSDGNTSPYARVLAKRKLLRLSGVEEDEIAQLLPPCVDELEALQDVELINRNILPPLRDIFAPHEIYLSVYAQAEDTNAKLAACEMRKEAIIQLRNLQNTTKEATTTNAEESAHASAKNVATSIAMSHVLQTPNEILSR